MHPLEQISKILEKIFSKSISIHTFKIAAFFKYRRQTLGKYKKRLIKNEVDRSKVKNEFLTLLRSTLVISKIILKKVLKYGK